MSGENDLYIGEQLATGLTTEQQVNGNGVAHEAGDQLTLEFVSPVTLSGKEQLLRTKADILDLPRRLCDFAQRSIRASGSYDDLGLPPQFDLYHWHEIYVAGEGLIEGRVAVFDRALDVYLDAFEVTGEDRVGLLEHVNGIISSFVSKDEHLLCLWDTMGDDRKYELIKLILKTATRIHDLANVVRAINFRALAEREVDDVNVTLAGDYVMVQDCEAQASKFYEEYIETFKTGLEISDGEAEIVQATGGQLIMETVFDINTLTPYSFFDQMGGGSFVGVVGLLKENKEKEVRETPLFGEVIPRKKVKLPITSFLGGFNQLRHDKGAEILGDGASIDGYYGWLQLYIDRAPERAARSFGVAEESIRQVVDLPGMIRERIESQKQIGLLVLGSEPMTCDEMVEKLRIASKSKKLFLIEAERLYRRRLLDPTLKVDDFTELGRRFGLSATA